VCEDEQLAYAGPNGRLGAEKAKEQRDQLKTRVIELKREKQSTLDKADKCQSHNREVEVRQAGGP